MNKEDLAVIARLHCARSLRRFVFGASQKRRRSKSVALALWLPLTITKPKLPTEDRKNERVILSLPNHWTLEHWNQSYLIRSRCSHVSMYLEPAFFSLATLL
jgi:hypothetical protein